MSPLALAFAFTALAGAATALGGWLAVHRWIRSDTGLSAALGFAAGAMLLVSVAEIVPKGADGLRPVLGSGAAWAATLALVAAGSLLTMLIQRRAGSCAHAAPGHAPDPTRRRVLRSGVVVALAVSLHNFPEGLATFVATLDDPAAGAGVALAIAIHNVPEGVAVAAPLYGAGLGRVRAFGAAALSGLAEPLGALLGYVLLIALLPPAAYALVFGLVAGIMAHIAVTELIPTARRLARIQVVATSLTAGAATMGDEPGAVERRLGSRCRGPVPQARRRGPAGPAASSPQRKAGCDRSRRSVRDRRSRAPHCPRTARRDWVARSASACPSAVGHRA